MSGSGYEMNVCTSTRDDNMGFTVDKYASNTEDNLMGDGYGKGRNGKDGKDGLGGKFGNMTREELEGLFKQYAEELRRLKELLNMLQKSFEDRLSQLMNELDRLRKENASLRQQLGLDGDMDVDALNALRDKYKFISDENEFNNNRTFY